AMTVVVGVVHALDEVGGVWRNVLVFLAVALPSLGAALAGIRDQRHYLIHERRSRHTARRLRRLEESLRGCEEMRTLAVIVAQAHATITAENAEWSSVVEFQDLEMVV
ncbi:MAG TPA: hypothetical protein VMG62_01470, partial [Solirubrobacteraceae bacterium]|nr:hypothetical protein [Solirubrobacteraceae bacterium]